MAITDNARAGVGLFKNKTKTVNMKSWFKNLFIPSGEKTTVVAYNSWIVRWYSWDLLRVSYGGNAYCTPMAEIFPSEEDAYKFAEQLKEAFKLLKQKGEGCRVTVESNQTKLASMT